MCAIQIEHLLVELVSSIALLGQDVCSHLLHPDASLETFQIGLIQSLADQMSPDLLKLRGAVIDRIASVEFSFLFGSEF